MYLSLRRSRLLIPSVDQLCHVSWISHQFWSERRYLLATKGYVSTILHGTLVTLASRRLHFSQNCWVTTQATVINCRDENRTSLFSPYRFHNLLLGNYGKILHFASASSFSSWPPNIHCRENFSMQQMLLPEDTMGWIVKIRYDFIKMFVRKLLTMYFTASFFD